jgi:hypothetical protein
MQGHGDLVAMPGEGFVNGIVDHLKDHVVETCSIMHITDVHAGPLAHGIKAAQHGNAGGIVILVVLVAHAALWLLGGMAAQGCRESGRFSIGSNSDMRERRTATLVAVTAQL